MVVQGSHVRAVGPPSTCSKNLATALEELRRREDIEWYGNIQHLQVTLVVF